MLMRRRMQAKATRATGWQVLFIAVVLCVSRASVDALHPPNQPTLSRMAFLKGEKVASIVFCACFISNQNNKVVAAAPTSPAEAIRRGAANIPGIGPTDILYPPSFQGKWKATRTLLSTSNPDVSKRLPDYQVRFLPSIDDQAVVADRGFNQLALEEALGRPVEADTVEWTFTNPNDLQFRYKGGAQKDIKVTKRASERTPETVTSSEFLRVTEQKISIQGIPSISARRVLSKWKVVDPGTIEGMEIIYNAGITDPMNAGASGTPQQELISKSKIRLERITSGQ